MTGSSPLTRGKQGRIQVQGRIRGLIPAHAGKTPAVRVSGFAGAAHPRSRGENKAVPLTLARASGSSPLTRGKQGRALDTCKSVGLIPAHAGKTWPTPRLMTSAWAHPRSRGENNPFRSRSTRPPGSSPLTRGKQPVSVALNATPGLIPAHAGKTVVSLDMWCCVPAHPRSRGENPCLFGRQGPLHGSSPLTRGKRVPLLSWQELVRLIPAHAGKTGASGR